MQNSYILAIDQGTSATKTVVVDAEGKIVAKAAVPLESHYPQPGYVEQDAVGIYENVLQSVRACLDSFRKNVTEDLQTIQACGISNQRETFVLWDKAGKPLCPAIVWQCKRSVDICTRLQGSDVEREIRQRTGLIIDPYFSGTKLLWLYETRQELRDAIDSGQAYFGTVDTWLLFRLTQGRSFKTDITNASRTLFFNLEGLNWDKEILTQFEFDRLKLPEVKPSSASYGRSDFGGNFPQAIPICAMIGDSHAAAFGEGCVTPGSAKATLGTGCSILLNTGAKRIDSSSGMVTTVCWSAGDRVDYALEGIIVTCGATITWLRDQIGLFADSRDTERIATALEDSGGVYLIPAFSGLGAPHWQMDLRAAVLGLTLGCDKQHIVRAALESIPYQIKDVVAAMEGDSELKLQTLKVDGGISANRFVVQFLADLLQSEVVTIGMPDVSALGAAYLAGLQSGLYPSIDHIADLQGVQNVFKPGSSTNRERTETAYQGWQKALETLKKT